MSHVSIFVVEFNVGTPKLRLTVHT